MTWVQIHWPGRSWSDDFFFSSEYQLQDPWTTTTEVPRHSWFVPSLDLLVSCYFLCLHPIKKHTTTSSFSELEQVWVSCNERSPGKERCFKLSLISERTLWKYKWVKIHPLKSIKWYVSDLKALPCPQNTKGLPSFSSAGPRLILVGCKWCFYSGGMGHMW